MVLSPYSVILHFSFSTDVLIAVYMDISQHHGLSTNLYSGQPLQPENTFDNQYLFYIYFIKYIHVYLHKTALFVRPGLLSPATPVGIGAVDGRIGCPRNATRSLRLYRSGSQILHGVVAVPCLLLQPLHSSHQLPNPRPRP